MKSEASEFIPETMTCLPALKERGNGAAPNVLCGARRRSFAHAPHPETQLRARASSGDAASRMRLMQDAASRMRLVSALWSSCGEARGHAGGRQELRPPSAPPTARTHAHLRLPKPGLLVRRRRCPPQAGSSPIPSDGGPSAQPGTQGGWTRQEAHVPRQPPASAEQAERTNSQLPRPSQRRRDRRSA